MMNDSAVPSVDTVPNYEVFVLNVGRHNVKDVFPSIVDGISASAFIAIDLELSGLGDRSRLRSVSIEERYAGLVHAAKSRSVLSAGLSFFIPSSDNGDVNLHKYIVETYNLLLLQCDSYVVDPGSMRFLAAHGFDFRELFQHGLRYEKGSPSETNETAVSEPAIVRDIFHRVIVAGKPVVFHNGFVDVVYLYQSFYADLPSTLESFVADLSEMFLGGLYDTKYIAEYHAGEKASFLEYLFKICQLHNEDRVATRHERMEFVSRAFPAFATSPSLLTYDCRPFSSELLDTISVEDLDQLCSSYATRGYCDDGIDCRKLHNVSLALAQEAHASRLIVTGGSEKKRKLENPSSSYVAGAGTGAVHGSHHSDVGRCSREAPKSNGTLECTDCISGSEAAASARLLWTDDRHRNKGHSAGFDAFMTGYVFAFYLSVFKDDIAVDRNRIHLSGKDIPLIVSKSHFARPSKQHQKICMMVECKLRGGRVEER